jgi:hypothetical protein
MATIGLLKRSEDSTVIIPKSTKKIINKCKAKLAIAIFKIILSLFIFVFSERKFLLSLLK